MAEAKTTVDHDEIRRWVESRGGAPARVKKTGRRGGAAARDPGILRVDFPGFSGEKTLEHIGWDEWFDAFEKNQLAFLYQDSVRGRDSRSSKLVARKNATTGRSGRGTSARSTSGGSRGTSRAKRARGKSTRASSR